MSDDEREEADKLSLGSPAPPKTPGDDDRKRRFGNQAWNFLRSASRNYDGIYGDRVTLDYLNMISVYEMDMVDRIDLNATRPRLFNLTADDRTEIQAKVDTVFQKRDWEKIEGRNWRSTVDVVVERHRDALWSLHHFADAATEADRLDFHRLLLGLLTNYIDTDEPTLERQQANAMFRCTYELLPPFLSDRRENAFWRVMEEVTSTICATVLSLHYRANAASKSETFISHASPSQKELLSGLMSHLGWSAWKKCLSACLPSQSCLVPMFPIGGRKDYERPTCVSAADLQDMAHLNYWFDPRDDLRDPDNTDKRPPPDRWIEEDVLASGDL